MPIDLEQARHAMIQKQVRPWDVLDPRVLETLAAVRREDFVAPGYRKLAFADLALPLEHGQSMMKPVVEGRLLQALDLQPHEEVLEVGTGSGFMTACLASLAREVVSIDIHADFVERARTRLSALGMTNARTSHADALEFDPGRRFDAVAVTGAVTQVPGAFGDWLRPGGRLFVVRGHAPAMEAVVLTRVGEEHWREESLFETDLDYLIGAAPQPRFVL
ncbi:MAG TPA: protein-L-isoaspartate O-methyltransferase [Xanthomonadaceae bacterium]|nr:protein-L-isoaspartate O-methyltransferase [Xanthomonadaceae bacterium]